VTTWIPEHGDRRRQVRTPVVAKARIRTEDKRSAFCKIVNYSMNGLCLEGVGLGLGKNARVEIRIALELSNGTAKIHWRKGTVVWVMGGRTGVSIDSLPVHK
jgi:hypothetical protein